RHRRRAVGTVRPRPSRGPEPRLLARNPRGRGGPAVTRFVPFELERWQSTWENRVRFNLSESGVHPLSIQELLGLAGASTLPLLDRPGDQARGGDEPAQPDGARAVGRRAARDRRAQRRGRRLAARGRGVPRSRARRADDALLLGKLRARDRGERAPQGVWAAG